MKIEEAIRYFEAKENAKKIGTRNQNLKYEFSGAYLPFY